MTEPATGLSARIAQHMSEVGFQDLPSTTVTAAKHVLLDASGVMLAASGMAPEAEPFIKLAAASGPGPSTILGTGLATSPASAALANGSLAHALDFEDAFDLAPGHPNASLVPALIALTQARGPVDGSSFLTALAAGGDLSCRIPLALRRRMEDGGWYPPPINAGMGAACGAGRLLGLGAEAMLDCLSLALCQVTMPGEIMHSRRTIVRAVREAFPAHAAVQSALLAEAGVAGFETPLEGKGGYYALYAAGQFDPDVLLDRLGDHYWIEQLTFKPWPSCRGTHPFVQMALELHSRGVAPAAISKITVLIDPVQRMLVEPPARKQAPSVMIDAKFSIPFATALALVRGKVTLDEFEPGVLHDADVLAVARKIDFEVVEGTGGSGGGMRVELHDGLVLEDSVGTAQGSPEHPLSEGQLREKFIDCAGRALVPLSRDRASRLADEILSLERCEDVGALFV
jgi:2-methylcitrate dehydratase PrpD